MTEEFSDLAKKLITDLYYQGTPEEYDIKFTTLEILFQLKSILPSNSIDEYMVLTILEELGYKPGYETKTLIKKPKDEYSKPTIERYNDLVYYWYFQKIDQRTISI